MKHPKYAKVIQLKNNTGNIALESLFRDLKLIQQDIEQNLNSEKNRFTKETKRNE